MSADVSEVVKMWKDKGKAEQAVSCCASLIIFLLRIAFVVSVVLAMKLFHLI